MLLKNFIMKCSGGKSSITSITAEDVVSTATIMPRNASFWILWCNAFLCRTETVYIIMGLVILLGWTRFSYSFFKGCTADAIKAGFVKRSLSKKYPISLSSKDLNILHLKFCAH